MHVWYGSFSTKAAGFKLITNDFDLIFGTIRNESNLSSAKRFFVIVNPTVVSLFCASSRVKDLACEKTCEKNLQTECNSELNSYSTRQSSFRSWLEPVTFRPGAVELSLVTWVSNRLIFKMKVLLFSFKSWLHRINCYEKKCALYVLAVWLLTRFLFVTVRRVRSLIFVRSDGTAHGACCPCMLSH